MGYNVYEDLGRPDAEAMFLKAGLMIQIQRILDERALQIPVAAKILGIDGSTLDDYLDGQFSEVPVEKLVQFLSVLGQSIEIIVSPTPIGADKPPKVSVRSGREQSAA